MKTPDIRQGDIVKYSQPEAGEEDFRFVVLDFDPERQSVEMRMLDWPHGPFAPISRVGAEHVEAVPPTQTMRRFFSRPDVMALQEIQKRNPPASKAHRRATAEIIRLAGEAGAGRYM